nr:MAG TPA: hypothetical protein [Caudoviricetes sp.]
MGFSPLLLLCLLRVLRVMVASGVVKACRFDSLIVYRLRWDLLYNTIKLKGAIGRFNNLSFYFV